MLFIFPFTYLVSFYLFYTEYDLDYYFQLPCFMSVLLKVWSPPTRQPVSSISMRTCQKHRFSVPIQDLLQFSSSQFSSVAQSCPTLCDPMNCSTPGLPVYHHLLEFTQTHVHWVGDAFQPSHPLSSPCPPALNASQHQSLFQWVNSSHEVAKVLEFQL